MELTNHISDEISLYRENLRLNQRDRYFGPAKASAEKNMEVVKNAYFEQMNDVRKSRKLPEFKHDQLERVCGNVPELRKFNDLSMRMGLSARFMMACFYDYSRYWAKKEQGPPKHHLADVSKITWAIYQVTDCEQFILWKLFTPKLLVDEGKQSFARSHKAISELLVQTGSTDLLDIAMDIQTLGLPACHRFCYSTEPYKKDPWRREILQEIAEELQDDRVLLEWMKDIGWTFDKVADYLRQ